VRTITIAKATFEKAKDRWKVGSPQKRQVENLILAVPPKPLAKLVHQGMPNNPIDAAVPRLRELKRIGSERIPMLHLVFKQNRFEDELPKEPVALLGSTLSLTFIDISQTWQGAIPPRLVGRKVLAVACSEPAMLPGGADREAEAEADAHAIADELKEYLDFTDDDVDEKLTRYRPDTDVRLSVNAIGTDTIRPPAHFDEVKGLFFAGDFCQNDFGITTIEAAVATGLAAAQAVVKSCGVGKVPDIKIPATLPDSEFVAMRYAWLPFAYGARAVSFAAEDEGSPAAGEAAQSVQQGREDGKAMLRYLLTPGLRPLP
jgi:hypothetical protein